MSVLTDFQTKIGVSPDGVFGPHTLAEAMKYFKLSKTGAAHLFGQMYHESAGFTVFSENLNYSAQGLLRTFPSYFNAATANSYARNPEKIANRVYANRLGNGSETSGDGWKYRGRGAIQLTGRNNTTAFSKAIHDPLIIANPDLIVSKYAFESGKWFFDTNNIWIYTDRVDDGTISKVTKKVNGGYNGLAERSAMTKKFYSWLV